MDVVIEKKDDHTLIIVLKGERHSFPSMLKDYLWKQDDTEFAAYTIEHPVLSEPKLILKTKSDKPEKTLKAALAAMKKDLEEFIKEFK